MDDLLPTDPRARRVAIAAWIAAAVIGSIAVWWLSSYLDSLTRLARTDRAASIALFRTRVLPALAVIVLIAVACGGLLLRQGLQVMRSAHRPSDEGEARNTASPQFGPATRAIGLFFVVAGSLLAIVPLTLLCAVIWMLRGA